MYHTGNYQAYPHFAASGVAGSNYQGWTDDNELVQNTPGCQIQTWPQELVQTPSDVCPTQYNSLQQPLYNRGIRPIRAHDYVGHYNSHSQGSWLLEQSNFCRRAAHGDPFPSKEEAALSHSHQSWNECTQIASSEPNEAVSLLEMAASTRPDPGTPDATSDNLNNVVRHYPCSSGFVREYFDDHTKKQFEPETIKKCLLKYGVEYKDLFFYRQNVNAVACSCPIADCKAPKFQGGDIKSHIERYHSEIISSKAIVVCSRKSNPESRCRIDNGVQGRHFLTHFRELHLNAHGKCPFCDIQVTRVPGYFKTHFSTCKKLTAKLL